MAGTKYTTARGVAERVTDRVYTKLGRPNVGCRTASTPLMVTDVTVRSATAGSPAVRREWPPDVQEHLTAAYGTAVDSIDRLSNETPELAERVSSTSPVLAAQLVWAVRHEMAMTLPDVLIRRTPLGALGHPGADVVARAASIVARELNWDADRSREEVGSVERFYRL